MDNHPINPVQLGHFFQVDGKQLQQQYKNYLSDYQQWGQKEHAAQWMLFEKNISPYLSIDETAFSSGELYTIVTNKAAKGRKGSIVAMIRGTQADYLIEILKKIPRRLRAKVTEVTIDMSASLNLAIKRCFPNADRVIDRFHVQQLAFDAVQETRIQYRWEALEAENTAYEQAKTLKQAYQPEILPNGDTVKQLLARSRYLLFKHPRLWSREQQLRAELLFTRYPVIQKAYRLSIGLGDVYRKCTSKEQAFKRLALWYNDVESSELSSFKTLARTVQTHYPGILNFFNNRATNAAAESFNAKVKSFRNALRGVRDVEFFLFRLAKLYA
ncbi:DDE transposase [Chitinophaga parva]|uniref:DDE transposase n=1 Tax=Chitinophaga parva TaxID=2169414 RepID=A0A2T7BPF6_9BACT|nr:transposase [Chitinophaga parva]PUZ29542.1 DDE transposase [Chitinophaga parva]